MSIAHPRGLADAPARNPDPAELASSNVPSGINIRPGSEDDGWAAPPPVELADGTHLYLYKDGQALHAAYEAIQSARELICLEVYIFSSDPTGRAFAELLCKKAREGVRVYVIYDSYGSMSLDRAMFRQMRQAGVRLQEFHPILPWESRYSWRLLNRDHEIAAVIRSASFGRQMCELFENDVDYAKKMELAEWRRRPTWDRVVQWVISRGRYWL